MNRFLEHINDHMTDRFAQLWKTEPPPDRLVIRPVDMWSGNPELGHVLCDGIFQRHGAHFELHGEHWTPNGLSDDLLSYLHGFTWLRDLRACAVPSARQQAQALMESWIRAHPRPLSRTADTFHPWAPALMGERLSLWIAHFDFFAADSDSNFEDAFFTSLNRQARALARALKTPDTPHVSPPLYSSNLPAAKGLLFCGLACNDKQEWTTLALTAIDHILRHELDPQGLHISRAPFMTLRFLRHLLDIRSALQAADHSIPPLLESKIAALVPVIRFFRYADKHMALMQGTLTGDINLIDSILSQAAVKAARIKHMNKSGFSKLNIGRTTLLMDHGPSGYHCAPLSFEMNYGRDRIFVNCGSHQSDETWRSLLSQTPAHTTLDLAGQGPAHSYKVSNVAHKEDPSFGYLEATHDGYRAETGLLHKRSLYLCQDGYDLRGEDTLYSDAPLMQTRRAFIRFHLHPKVIVSQIQNGTVALLRLPNGIGWRFQHAGGHLTLESSIYAGALGTAPRKAEQLVITADLTAQTHSIKWALRREGV